MSNFVDHDYDMEARECFLCEDNPLVVLKFLIASRKLKRGHLIIHSVLDGLDESVGMALFDAIAMSKHKTVLIGYGAISSMGSLLMQSAKWRIMRPHATQTVHYGTIDIGLMHQKDAERLGKAIERFNTWVEEVYLWRIRQKNPMYTKSQVQKLLSFDTELTGPEALRLGLVDELK